MKIFLNIVLLLILFSFGFNLYFMDFSKPLIGEENGTYVIGLSAGICGLILYFIFLKFPRLKENLKNQAK